MPRRFEPIEVVTPFIVLLCAQFVQILPGIKAGIVAIIKKEPQRVIPDGLDRRYLHVLLAGLQNALTGSVSFDFGRRRIDTKVFKREVKGCPILILQRDLTRCLSKSDCARLASRKFVSPTILGR